MKNNVINLEEYKKNKRGKVKRFVKLICNKIINIFK